jgi:hypothetical protein
MRIMMAALGMLLGFVFACGDDTTSVDASDARDDARDVEDAADADADPDPDPDADPDADADGDTDVPPPPDNATLVSAGFPASLSCGEARRVTISFRNTGSTTWTEGAFLLAAVAGSDPLYGAGRVFLGTGETVVPDGTHDFTFTLLAPNTAATYTTAWRMLHEGIGPFGDTASGDVVVNALPDPEAILASATIVNSPPDIASWPVTTTITRLTVGTDGVAVEFDKADGAERWPDITPPGWTGPLQYTLWLFLNIDGEWWGSGIIQFWYGLAASGGDITMDDQIAINWVYDARWGAMEGHQPVPGENVGFLVAAGNHRGVTDASQSPVQERSNLVVIPFPASAGAVFTF